MWLIWFNKMIKLEKRKKTEIKKRPPRGNKVFSGGVEKGGVRVIKWEEGGFGLENEDRNECEECNKDDAHRGKSGGGRRLIFLLLFLCVLQ